MLARSTNAEVRCSDSEAGSQEILLQETSGIQNAWSFTGQLAFRPLSGSFCFFQAQIIKVREDRSAPSETTVSGEVRCTRPSRYSFASKASMAMCCEVRARDRVKHGFREILLKKIPSCSAPGLPTLAWFVGQTRKVFGLWLVSRPARSNDPAPENREFHSRTVSALTSARGFRRHRAA